MRKRRQVKGFSLTEVLLAVGTLAVGMVFISGTFLTGIHFSTIATERTMAAVVADEAFAKISIYAKRPIVNPDDPDKLQLVDNYDIYIVPTQMCIQVNDVFDVDIPDYEFAYDKQYYWSALCRRTEDRLVQVTVFVSRKIGANTQYRNPADPFNRTYPYPGLVTVDVSGVLGSNVLTIQDFSYQTFINDGYTIVENETGQIFRVLDRNADQPNTIQLDRPLPCDPVDVGKSWFGLVWVIPPPVDGGKNPCIAVYQKLIRF